MELKISDLLDGMEAPGVGLKETRVVSTEHVKEIAMNKIETKTIRNCSGPCNARAVLDRQ